ncbi:MAG TPA: DUF5657 family protein [Patescibacteria group bacterium]|nr:DUF5657 family protein [Patescibacteria group bacterium]
MEETIPVLGIQIWTVIKVLSLILLGMYLVFSLVLVRQVKLMTTTLQLGFASTAKTLAFAHLAFAVFVFLAAIVIL